MRFRKSLLVFIILAACWAVVWAPSVAAEETSAGPKIVPLWEGRAPGAVGDEDADKPTLALYLPPASTATGVGVVVCPGGAYAKLAMDHEGKQIAQWLNSIGIAAFVLKYRLGPRYHHPAPLLDAQRALRTMRWNAQKFHLNADDIGIWGFSAGGHLASTVATHFDNGDPRAVDPIDRVSCRPDFAILAYPVISFTTEYVHRGSMENLLGKNPDPKLVELLSNENQVTRETPPTFLFATDADRTVPPENSILFYLALRKAGVPAEIHIFQHGPHGVGLAPTDQVLSLWSHCLANWLKARSWHRQVER
ncbi:MAG: alpha/beta hydrolase [Acidobacteriia bacterium]|nr:alpha/beta hydrolase [Terriglobia bacterium]